MVMHARTTGCAALAAAGLLALPGVAGAAGSKQVFAGPLKVKGGYSMSLIATDGGAKDDMAVVLSKTVGKSSQMHNYDFPSGVKVVIKGSKATIKGSMGRYGTVSLKLNASKKTRGVVPKGCTGKLGASRSGIAAGKLKLVADTTYFRTIAAKRLKAFIPGSGNIKCDGNGAGGSGGGTSHSVMLMNTADTAKGSLSLTIMKTDSSGVLQMVTLSEPSTPQASVLHMIMARAGASGLQVAGDLSSATAVATTPFLAGSLKFAGESMGTMSSGSITGDFAAKFDSIGTLGVQSADGTAMLMKS
jgi:hypothetical protein